MRLLIFLSLFIIICSVTKAEQICFNDISQNQFPDTSSETTEFEVEYEDISLIQINVEIPGSDFNSHTTETTYPEGKKNPYRFNAKQLIIPGALIAVGGIGLTGWWKNNINNPIKKDLQKNGHHPLSFDDYLMFAPAVAGYGMNLLGFHGQHNVADATIIYATAYLLLGATALPLKYAIDSPRPNLENNHSFPSGHTAMAFAGAELLRREYRHVSPWIGVAGYVVATGTAFMRLYNNAHWLNDVIAGAGLGILCAEAAYWLYPVITKTFFKKRYNANIFLAPSVSTQQFGLAGSITF